MEYIKQLEQLLSVNNDITEDDIVKTFNNSAELLLGHIAIKRGEEIYLFSDIEFYFYNQYHKDIITHPRNCGAMQWYVNDFGGIDLTFKSSTPVKRIIDKKNKLTVKPILTDKSYFGGILIRELCNARTGERLEGPWACAELFRVHDAQGVLNDYPILTEFETGMNIQKATPRMNLKRNNQNTIDKVKYILSGYANEFSDEDIFSFTDEFNKYQFKCYRYRINQ